MNEHIKIFIKNKANEIPDESIHETNVFLPFYNIVSNNDLAYLFAYMHYKFNNLFEFLNHKSSTNNHYNAHESRELMYLIELYRKINKALLETEYQFKIDNDYLSAIDNCELFLSGSGGSAIPEDFKKVYTIEMKPIFELIKQTNKNDNKPIIKTQRQVVNNEKRKVFIVHGHDNETKQEVARFIESVGLESIILHEQASRSMTIIEKIEYYSDEVNFAIVLYTPCDKGRGTKETTVPARNRARQNVVFEHGYLMAKLGRKNICALVKGEIETPSDISGVVYTPLDSFGGWKSELVKELKACDYQIESLF